MAIREFIKTDGKSDQTEVRGSIISFVSREVEKRLERNITKEEKSTIDKSVDNLLKVRGDRYRLLNKRFLREVTERQHRLAIRKSIGKIERHIRYAKRFEWYFSSGFNLSPMNNSKIRLFVPRTYLDLWGALGNRRPPGFIPLWVCGSGSTTDGLTPQAVRAYGVWLSEPRWVRSGSFVIYRDGSTDRYISDQLF